jgi:aspartate kinase
MKVMKFGGTSVGSPQRIKDVSRLIDDGEPKIVVLSALSGTTNALIRINDDFYAGKKGCALQKIEELELIYRKHASELYSSEEYKGKTLQFFHETFEHIRSFADSHFSMSEAKQIVGQGELLSTNMVINYMKELGLNATLIPALEFMRTGKDNMPDEDYIKKNLIKQLSKNTGYQIYLTQGFICRNAYGEMDNLLRGGSDYSASLIGAAVNASVIQIWTDIDGMHNNDPREVDNTYPVHYLSFEEAAELAYFGAKILHPTCVLPAKKAGIPVKLLNTMEPSAEGTVISNYLEKGQIKAVAAKDNITVINITSSRMFMAYGFMAKVYDIFNKYKTCIDVVSTSEVGVSLSIDNDTSLGEIVNELESLGNVEIDKDMTIICVVGDLNWHNVGFEAATTEAMQAIPVRMISYGGTPYNISYVIKSKDKKKALQSLNTYLFNRS